MPPSPSPLPHPLPPLVPVPPNEAPIPRGTRTFPTHTKLGRLIQSRGLRAYEFALHAGIYPRDLTELLAGRKRPTTRSLVRLCRALDVEADDILEADYPFLAPAPQAGYDEAQLTRELKEIHGA